MRQGGEEGTFRVVGEDEEADAGGAGAGAEDGDALGVTPEVPHVLVEPPQRLDLVQEPVVALGRLVPCAQEACGDGWGHAGRRPPMDHIIRAEPVVSTMSPRPTRDPEEVLRGVPVTPRRFFMVSPCPHAQPMTPRRFFVVFPGPDAQPMSPKKFSMVSP